MLFTWRDLPSDGEVADLKCLRFLQQPVVVQAESWSLDDSNCVIQLKPFPTGCQVTNLLKFGIGCGVGTQTHVLW